MPEQYMDRINRILRDFEGYTGDGKGGVGALPVGDRSTASKPISKRDLREVMEDFGGVISAAEKVLQDLDITGALLRETVAAATTTNITLSGEKIIDGVLTNSSRVLVKNQTTTSANGVYVSASGAWSRAADMNEASEIERSGVYVTGGTVNAGKQFYTASAVTTLGTDAITFIEVRNQSGLEAEVSLKVDAADVAALKTLILSSSARRYGNRADLSGVSGGSGPGNVDIVFNEVIAGKKPRATAVNVVASGAGTGYVRSWVKSGNTFTMHDEAALSLVAGYQSVAVSLDIPEGGYLGFASGGVIVATTVGVDPNGFQSSTGGGATFTSASASNTGTFAVQIVVSTETATATPGAAGKVSRRGSASVEWKSGGAVVNQYRVDGNAFSSGGTLDSVDIQMDGAGTPVAYVYVRQGSVMAPYASVSLGRLAAGIHKGITVGLDVPPGGFVGIYCDKVANSATPAQWPKFYYGSPATFTDADDDPVGAPALVRFNCTENSLDTSQKVYDDLSASLGLPASRAVFAGNTVMVCNNGQSLAIGSGNTPQTADLRTSVIYADTSGAESTLPGTLAGVWELLETEEGMAADATAYVQVGTTRGQGGQPIANLAKGGSVGKYEETISDITDVAPDAVSCVTWSQGENDVVINTSYSAYYSALIDLVNDYNTDILAITGQTRPVHLISYQTVSARSDDMDVPRAQLRAAQDHPHIIMAGPMYHLNFHDGLHYDGESAVIAGAYFALAQKRTIIDGVPWEPLMPVRSEIVGSCIDLYFNKRGLTFDTTNFPAQIDYGFTVQNDAGADQTISSVEVLGSDRVRIRCAATPGADWAVTYGRDAVTGKTHPTTTTAYTAHGGNLRDNQGDYLTLAGYPMHNWSVLFSWAV